MDTILYNSEVMPNVHGFVPYKSFVTNALEHSSARHVLNVDVKDFFPSIKLPLVAAVFESLGYSEKVSLALAKLVTLNGTLPQGAPTSPALANLVMRPFDAALASYAVDHDLCYSRYADDITISSRTRIDDQILNHIRLHLSALGLSLNDKKTRFMGSNTKKEVTGLVIGADGPRLSRQYLNSARGWFFNVIRDPRVHAHELDRLRGTLALVRQVGGSGSKRVIELGSKAVMEVERAAFKSRSLS